MRKEEKKKLAELRDKINNHNVTGECITLAIADAKWLLKHVEYWDKMHDILEGDDDKR